jgi:beta-phosphoglucomutase-like phosphatase (HAD superfamily)
MCYQAVIFDLFGTLVDFSPREHDRVLADMAAVLGVPYHAFACVWSTTCALQEQGLFGTKGA